jgi:hypothetical protein
MICKLFTSMFRNGSTVEVALPVGTLLEELWEATPTGLRMRIIFFNGDVDPSTSLCSAPYYILEYLSQDPLPLISSDIVFEGTVPIAEARVPIMWRRHPSQSTLERYINCQATDTFVHILQTSPHSENSGGETVYSVEPWVNGRHVIAGEGIAERLEGNDRKRFVVVECRVVHEGKRWRII